MNKIAVVGAGLVGSLQAILLAKKGYQVDVFERRPDLRRVELTGGKSINLALSSRGWKALKLAGIEEDILEMAIPMYQRCMHAVNGDLTYQPYGVNQEAIYSVSRGGLNQKLMNLADNYPGINYHFNLKCQDIDLKAKKLIFEQSETGAKETVDYEKVFATDGAFSAVRMRLQKTPMFNYAQNYLSHGYKELVIPANEDGSHKLDKNCLHIWPRGEFMMIALANLDGSFTCTLFFPMEGEQSFDTINTTEKVEAFFKKTFPDAIPMMPTLLEDYNNNPTSSLVTINCNPWNHLNDVLLLGDAAHALVPFYGQGMNSGFEDCTVFSEMLDENKGDWDGLMDKYSKQRVPDANAISDLALENYIEMRGKTADPDFLLRKKIETKFTKLHPQNWLPLYSQVTFSHIRYSDAIKNGERQRAIMDEVMKMPHIHQRWDDENVMEKMVNLLGNETKQAN
jgi:kynurenine 3-monooxygenase